ncbi:hypothetical protein GS452_27550 [Rhodococcus hoagii]|nr:hypothetical protein [Prescottella equi]
MAHRPRRPQGRPEGAATFIANSLAARARLFDAYHVHQTRNEILGTTNATDSPH